MNRGDLQERANTFGDFWVQYSKREGLDRQFHKRKSVIECWHDENWYYGLNYLDIANHRQIFKDEIVLDMDDDVRESTLRTNVNRLNSRDLLFKVYFTGSKGYHIHVQDKRLIPLRKLQREYIREMMIIDFGCDLMKKSEGHGIAIEERPHWNTGNIKTLIYDSKIKKWIWRREVVAR